MEDPLPDTMLLEANKWTMIVLIPVSLGLAGLTYVFHKLSPNDWQPKVMFVVFLLTAGAGVLGLILKRPTLTLTRAGFYMNDQPEKLSFNWHDVSDFRVYTDRARGIPTSRNVVFDLLKDEKKLTTKALRMFMKGSIHLTDNYGMKAKDLAALMNAFRERALKG